MKNMMFILMIAGLLYSCNRENTNLDQLVEELKSAQNDGDNQHCAELVYPVDYKMSDGTTFTINNEKDLRTEVADWYKNNPQKRERPALVYPVKMTFSERTYTINNVGDMKRIRKACRGERDSNGEEMRRRIIQHLLDNGIERDKIEATMGGLRRAMGEASGKGEEYQMSEELHKYFSETVGLTDEQVEKVKALAIRMLMRITRK